MQEGYPTKSAGVGGTVDPALAGRPRVKPPSTSARAPAAHVLRARSTLCLLDGLGEAVPLLDAARVEAEAEPARERECLLVLLAMDAARDLRVLPVAADLARDVVLRHQVHVRARAELLGDEAQDRLGLVEQARHDQMPDDEAAPCHPAVVQHQVADLAVHLDDR